MKYLCFQKKADNFLNLLKINNTNYEQVFDHIFSDDNF